MNQPHHRRERLTTEVDEKGCVSHEGTRFLSFKDEPICPCELLTVDPLPTPAPGFFRLDWSAEVRGLSVGYTEVTLRWRDVQQATPVQP